VSRADAVRRSDPSCAQEATEVDEVEENSVEAVVAVHEREVEAPTFTDEPRQCDLRLLGVVLNQRRNSDLLEELQTAVGEPRCLVGVHDDVSCGGVAVGAQAFADEQR